MNGPMPTLLLVSAAALAATWFGVALVRAMALRRQWLDHPNERSAHVEAVPRGGGLAIVVVTTAASFGAAPLLAPGFDRWAPLFVAGVVVAIVSWIDDLRSLRISLRFAIHLAAALAVVATVGGFEHLALPRIGVITLGTWAGIAVAIVWVVGLTNAYNFMDGIDGIAGMQALVAGVGWLIAGGMTHAPDAMIVGAAIAAAALGFLLHNWSPASIFMGDVGSAFLGYLFAAVTVTAARHDARLAAVGGLLVWPFLFDTIFTMLRRWKNGEEIAQAHQSHLYQRLVRSGVSHARVSLLYGVLDLGGLGCALAVLRGGEEAVAVYVALPLMALALWGFVVWSEHRSTADAA